MASSEKTKLPNLKICIDNDESESDDDHLSLTEEPQISIGDGEEDTRIANPVHDELVVPDSPGSERVPDDDVQFNVYLNKYDTKPAENASKRQTRRYENKEGNFVTGIEFTEQISAEKLQERAKRFGIDYKPEPTVNLKELYESLGLKAEDLNQRDERGIRLDAIHLRGVNEMNTKDVFNYFKEFAAGSCEWIDDESCNIVWLDKMTAARAMLKLSRSYKQVMTEHGIKVPVKQKPDKTKKKTENNLEGAMEEDGLEQSKDKHDVEKEGGEERDEERMEEDNDELDLTEDKQPNVEETQDKKIEQEEKMEDEGIEEGEITESDSEPEIATHHDSAFSKIPWPPGKWRLGAPYKDKSNYLFLRFATKADVKLPGAEKRSKYYQKYGNPNYGGRVGLLSRSMKQKLRGRRGNEDFDTFGVPDSGIVVSDRNQVSYEDDLFSDTIVPVEVEEIDIYSKPQKLGKNSKKLLKKPQSEEDDEEEEMNRSDGENDFPVIERVMSDDRNDVRGTDSDVDEEELERLLGAKEKKPVMRMYADDLEEKQKVHRQRKMVGALTIVADARKKVMRVQDARQLITGVDLRAALQEKEMNRQQQRSPISWTRSRSRSLSPNFERDLDEGMNFKIITPMHMTIENEVLSESEDMEEPTPEPEPVKEVRRKKRVTSPVGTKSKMDEIEKPKDIRSRLSQKAREDLDVRIAQRSPNVRSRLSKRVSPDSTSPVRYSDTRISRVRRSRSHDHLRSKFNRSHSPLERNRRPIRHRSRTRSPVWRRNNTRYRSPIRRSPVRRFNRSRSRSPINRRVPRSNVRSRSPIHRRVNDRTRSGRDARSRLGRKSRSPTDTESESDNEQIAPSRIKMTVEASSSSSSSSSSSDSSSDNSSSSSDSSSSSSSSSGSSSSSSDSDSDSDASERSAIRNKKINRKLERPRQQDKYTASRKQNLSHGKSNGPRRKARRPLRSQDD